MRPIGMARKTLPSHPQLYYDEILSGWIVALARANRTKVHTLSRSFGGNANKVWNRDVDRMAPDAVIRELADLTGISIERIERATLRHVAEQLDVDHHPNGSATWLLPLGIWHRKRTRYGLQFCPICLRLDQRPHIRRSWRLAFYTECEVHRTLMLDRCPKCSAPFAFFRGELGARFKVEAPPLSVCTECGFDMAYAGVQRIDWPDWRLTVATRTLQMSTDFGFAPLEGHLHAPAHELFLALRIIIKVLSSASHRRGLLDAVAELVCPDAAVELAPGRLAYEQRSVLERHLLFGMSVWLLMDWPSRFERVVRKSGVAPCRFVADQRHVPEWFRAQLEFMYSPQYQMGRTARAKNFKSP